MKLKIMGLTPTKRKIIASENARIRFDPGPAKDIKAESRLGFLRLYGSNCTGFAQPKGITGNPNALNKNPLKHFSCLKFENEYVSLDTIRESLGNDNLEAGLEKIENHIFTTPLMDENSNPLPPTKAKYEIGYTNICNISENKYIVLFLTTQQKRESSLLIPDVLAAGGWTGDSHMALINDSDIKIYERFPFTANLIKLPKENTRDVIIRFQAYYWCGKVITNTNKDLVIECSGNIYSYNFESEKFDELAVCGNRVKDGSYMTNNYECYDNSSNRYLSN